MKDGKSVLLMLALIIFFVYVLRNFLGKASAFFFVPIDSILFISHSIPPVIMWMFFGILIGIICGSIIAVKKYKLDLKLIIYPISVLVITMCMVLLISFIFRNKRNEGNTQEDLKGITSNPEYLTSPKPPKN